jgi:hypothetical protein
VPPLLLLYRPSTSPLLKLTIQFSPCHGSSPSRSAYCRSTSAPWCPPNLSASQLVEQVAGAVEFWLCFPVFWHQSHSCVCSLLAIVSTLRSDSLLGLLCPSRSRTGTISRLAFVVLRSFDGGAVDIQGSRVCGSKTTMSVLRPT